jgi:hypothetical protein
MPCRLLTESSWMFAYSPFCFLSTSDPMVRISEQFYCATICTGMHSGIHPLWPLYSHHLKFSLDSGSIVKHTTPLSSFSKFNGTYPLLIYSFSFSFFISISFCSSLTSSLFLLCFMFRTFILHSYLSDFLFLNIFEYLYTYVLVVSQ